MGMQDSLITQAEDCQIQAAGIIQWFVAFMATYPSMAAQLQIRKWIML
jgi:hypothetical protein